MSATPTRNRVNPDVTAPFPGYHAAFDRLEGPIGRLLSLSQVQETLLSLMGDIKEKVILVGDRKEAVEFIAGEIRTTAGELADLWTEVHNAAPDASKAEEQQ